MWLFRVAAGSCDLRMNWCEQSLLNIKILNNEIQNLPRKGRSLQNEGCWFSSLLLFSSGQTWADSTYSDILPPITSRTTSSIISKHETETWTVLVTSCGFHNDYLHLIFSGQWRICWTDIALLSEIHVTSLVVCWVEEEGELSEEHVILHFVRKALRAESPHLGMFGFHWTGRMCRGVENKNICLWDAVKLHKRPIKLQEI